ncbi:MAG: hypothetical protein FWC80_06555 [Firmicutes bacterium]|nr:hypothetical protein [Bacillota bacterium]
MKRTIIIISLFLLMIGFSVGELIIHRHIYTRIHNDLLIVNMQMDEAEGNLSDSTAMQTMNNTMAFWNRRKTILTSVSNSNIIRIVDEHLTRLHGHLEQNMYDFAKVQLAVTTTYLEDLIKELNPVPGNIL